MKRKIIKVSIIFAILICLSVLYSLYSHESKVSLSNSGFCYGNTNAKVKVYLYTSSSCKKCKNLFNNIKNVLSENIKSNKIQLIIKPIDKEFYLYNISEKNDLLEIDRIYNNQLEQKNKSLVSKNRKIYKKVKQEVEQNKVDIIPTLYINKDKYIGNYKTTEFRNLLNNYLKK